MLISDFQLLSLIKTNVDFCILSFQIIEPSVYTQSELNEVRGMIAEYLPYEL